MRVSFIPTMLRVLMPPRPMPFGRLHRPWRCSTADIHCRVAIPFPCISLQRAPGTRHTPQQHSHGQLRSLPNHWLEHRQWLRRIHCMPACRPCRSFPRMPRRSCSLPLRCYHWVPYRADRLLPALGNRHHPKLHRLPLQRPPLCQPLGGPPRCRSCHLRGQDRPVVAEEGRQRGNHLGHSMGLRWPPLVGQVVGEHGLAAARATPLCPPRHLLGLHGSQPLARLRLGWVYLARTMVVGVAQRPVSGQQVH